MLRRAAVTTVLGWLAYLPWLLLIPILAFFFLKDADDLQRFAIHLLPEGRLRWRGRELIDEINRTLALYVRVQVIAGVLIGFICSIGFAVLDVPYALVLGVLAGFMEFVPLVGPGHHRRARRLPREHPVRPPLMGLTLLFLAILRVVQDYVIYPRLVASGMKLHPLAIIVTLLCGAHLAGVAGLFLAIPAAAVLMVSYRYLLLQLGQESLLGGAGAPRDRAGDGSRPGRRTPTGVARRARLPARSSGIRVAVVDNDEEVRRSLVELLEQAGATVFFARSAAEALRCWSETPPGRPAERSGHAGAGRLRAHPPDPGAAARTRRHRSPPPRSAATRPRRTGPAAWPPASRSTSPSPSIRPSSSRRSSAWPPSPGSWTPPTRRHLPRRNRLVTPAAAGETAAT